VRSVKDSGRLAVFAEQATAVAYSSKWRPSPGIDQHIAGLLPGDTVDTDLVVYLLAAGSAFTGLQQCPIGGALCAGGGDGEILGDAIDTLALMPPGAGGSPANVAPARIALASGLAANNTALSGRSEQVPEPVLLALLALGLVGVGTGIRKYVA
jgi:hypothetical protein